ncbi:hypothetical protein [Nocardioides panacisoli]
MAVNGRMLDFLHHVQSGVLGRWQLLEHGLSDNDIERMLRRRELARAAPGVYVSHTGPLTLVQRQWVAVLACWPAALTLESAVPGERPAPIHVAIEVKRNLRLRPPGAIPHRMTDFRTDVDWRAAPPRVRLDRAVLELMQARIRREDVAGAYAALANACHRRTTPDRIIRALGRRERVSGRRLIEGMLTDVRDGVCSVLERGYLERVERPHGLPRAERQRVSSATGRRTAQDVRYEKYGVVIELDGRAIHDNPVSWDADARRDLAELAVSDAVTARVTYGLVFGGQCETARWVGQILRRQGWDGLAHRCPQCPEPP